MLEIQNQAKSCQKPMQLDITYFNDLPVEIKQEDELIIEDLNHDHDAANEVGDWKGVEYPNKSYQYQSISKSKKRSVWCDRDAQVLLELWAERATDLRRLKRNGHIYQEMSFLMNNKFSPEEVHVKIRNLTQKYREEKKERGASGGSASNWKFYNTVDTILGSASVNCPEVLETFLLENTSDGSCQPSPEPDPLLSPVLPSSPTSPQSPIDATSTSTAATVPSHGKKRNYLGEVINMIKEQNIMLKRVVEDSHSLSTAIVNAIRVQNETSKEFVILMKNLVDKI